MNIDNQINKENLRNNLVELEARIQPKILHLCFTNKKLPFERLSKGRQLKETVRQTIKYLDEGNNEKVNEYLEELNSRGVNILRNNPQRPSNKESHQA